jgi:hypothetical protein
MEPRGCKRWQSGANQIGSEPPKQAKTVALGCDRLLKAAHGKEGVSGSSPEEGSAKAPQNETFCFRISLQIRERGAGMEPVMEPFERRFSQVLTRWRILARRLRQVSA